MSRGAAVSLIIFGLAGIGGDAFDLLFDSCSNRALRFDTEWPSSSSIAPTGGVLQPGPATTCTQITVKLGKVLWWRLKVTRAGAGDAVRYSKETK